MNKNRKGARDFLNSIKTTKELIDYIDSLNLTDEQKEIAKDIYLKGLSHTQIAMKYNISIEKSHKITQKLLDKVL